MDEFDLINSIITPLAGRRDDVVLGIGDDGAIVRTDTADELVIVADTIVEGVHFPSELAPFDIGYRAAVVNLSDIAAMGATPRWATLALTIPTADADWLKAFMSGLSRAFNAAQVALVGGDTTRGALTITVQVIGAVPRGRALTRHGARPGDAIYVTGTLGDAAAGLQVIQRAAALDVDRAFLVERFKAPTARFVAGQIAREFASACIDISDGLLADIGHIAQRSVCGAEINRHSLPISAALSRVAPEDALQLAATGGDDYELCFTVPSLRCQAFELALRDVVPVTRIGTMTAGQAVILRNKDGGEVDIPMSGYLHFN